MVIVRNVLTSGEALKKAIDEYDPYLLLDAISVKITYIGNYE
jgi:Ni,Fe-hydrogenase maturation factor